MKKNDNEFETGQPEIGEFPFPLPKGSKESPYLSWLRNHSNYMVTRGFLDYLRIAAVMMRGILLNIMIILPFIFFLSIAIGLLYGPQLRSATIHTLDVPTESMDSFAKKLTGKVSETVTLPTGNTYTVNSIDTEIFSKLSEATKTQLLALKIHSSSEHANSDPDQIGPLTETSFRIKHIRETLRPALVSDLVSIVRYDKIYAPQRFKHNNLSPATVELLNKSGGNAMNLSGAPLRHFNRLLLESAYPEISKNGEVDTGLIYGLASAAGLTGPMPKPYSLTIWAGIVALALVLLVPILRVFSEIRGHRKNVAQAGGDSSVQSRDRWERFFGVALLLVLLTATFETLPILVDQFHHFLIRPDMNWNAVFTSVAGVSVAVMGAAGKLLSALSGFKKKLAMLVISLLGILAPLLVLLYVTDFLVYPPTFSVYPNWFFPALTITPLLFALLIIIGMGYGLVKGSFNFREQLRLLLWAMLFIIGTVLILVFSIRSGEITEVAKSSMFAYFIVSVLAVEIFFYCRLVVDINWTSIHGLYRDRLASAYLVGHDTKGDVAIEEDINLWEIGQHEQGSVAPYHLINTTLNLQGSKDISLRDRSSDFFVFSKRFVGGDRTGYCRSVTLEQVHPQMNLATAMAISAAAASPNMGRATSPALVAMMVLLNIRLGYWLPNPGLIEERLHTAGIFAALGRLGQRVFRIVKRSAPEPVDKTPGFTFQEVFDHELGEVERRWHNVYADAEEHERRSLYRIGTEKIKTPTTGHGLVGIGFSGGGIRSATINLGIAQALHARGVFEHIDYMSTVSGGGYLGSSISTLMRRKSDSSNVPRAKAGFHTLPRKFRSEIEGVVDVSENDRAEKIVTVTGHADSNAQKEYRFLKFDELVVKTGDKIKKDQELIARHNALLNRFKWRVRPMALLNEMMMRLDETHKWVNLSDGGHIENLAGIELLRRRCRFIIIGDGEADPKLSFNGLATLIRYARIDLGIEIDIKTDNISPERSKLAVDEGREGLSQEHWALGTITYPPLRSYDGGREIGYLLYLKSSFSGDEDEVIKEYRYRNPSFPHQSTADQFFNEEQFECYRALGEHIGAQPFRKNEGDVTSGKMSYEEFRTWFEGLNPCQKPK